MTTAINSFLINTSRPVIIVLFFSLYSGKITILMGIDRLPFNSTGVIIIAIRMNVLRNTAIEYW